MMSGDPGFYEEDEDSQALWEKFEAAAKVAAKLPDRPASEWRAFTPALDWAPESDIAWVYDAASRRIILAQYDSGTGHWDDLDGRPVDATQWRELEVPQPPDGEEAG